MPVWDLISSHHKKVVSDDLRGGTVRLLWAPATLLGAAMVARGEIGLITIQIGLNKTSFLSNKAFLIGV